jgi:Spy/CpxP family protein refolding chaperone
MPAAEAAFGAMGHHDPGGWGGPGGDHDGPPTPAEFRDHAEFFVAFALHRLGATTEQQDKVLKIVDAAVDQATPVIEKHRANRDALHDLLKSGTIDRTALEKLRTEEVALADDLSKVLTGAIGDSAEVLTPEQRSELIEHLDRFRHHR